MIGNLHTVALVGIDGSIDWCCLPHFDSPSVFGALLDAGKGGFFKISPVDAAEPKQMYLPDTNILITRFLNSDGSGEIVDFMPVKEGAREDASSHDIYRVVRSVRGAVRFKIECRPALHYGERKHFTRLTRNTAVFEAGGMTLTLHAPIRLKRSESGVVGEFTVKEDESVTFVLRHVENRGAKASAVTPPNPDESLNETLRFWHRWVSRIQYRGRWREMVTRSALTLKLLTYAPSGSIVAAATTSLPEVIGGSRNWDYRFTWIRDASFTLYALLRLGFQDEASGFMNWIQTRLKERNKDGSLNVLYGIRGNHDLKEKVIAHWEGYRGSSPVRIGNAAHDQVQLDIYGELLDSVYLFNKHGSPISAELWESLQPILDHVCRHWRKPDMGIWEFRNGPRHFVYSKVMCWVALDRAIRIAEKRRLPGDTVRWKKNADEIYVDVMKNGWNPRIKSFVQQYGSTAVDASVLLLPLVKFISPTDPRMISTLHRVRERLVSDSLVRRYDAADGVRDGLPGSEGTFSMCTFWYAEAMARAGMVSEARWVFEKMLGYANHLGLYSEQLDVAGHQVGNFPQAFTHLGLISAAINLDAALDKVKTPLGAGFQL